MTFKTTYKNRGKFLEDAINATNRQYLERDLALIQKIPTPTIVNTRTGKGRYSEKSTVDFIGVSRGKHVAFDAKELSTKIFPFSRLKPHQYNYLLNVHKQRGEAFILILFKQVNELYKLDIFTYAKLKRDLDRKSIPYEWFKSNLKPIKSKNGIYYDYLNVAHKYI
ncbi:Holliday junction resolvase RecU [Staphylococcus pseudintermedius]|uniref:Holliday junction resolvase RecU n=1 Tax=Staphylococcus pseudintermedius TaxID=283734 RepID=UPI00288408CA|nr:Holliday junction resolvase RecU [Staphylococcus pseudintermedius]MDT0943314.1 Holliday junction resolvase RecU [Staphylococcus pseudintermedius]